MLHRLALHLTACYHQTRHRLLTASLTRRCGDTGAMISLEMIILALGVVAIAGLLLSGFRDAVASRLNQLK